MTPASQKSLGIVIPSFNMAQALSELMASIEHSGLSNIATEIVIVDDGSTDDTASRFDSFKDSSNFKDKWKIIKLPSNLGRFKARFNGANFLQTEFVLFLDSRVNVPADFTTQLSKALNEHNCLMAAVRIDPSKSIFDLYWERTHTWAFKKYYEELDKGLWLRPETYDSYQKGTGCFLCPREIFISCCNTYLKADLKSDDTLLLKDISARIPIFVPPYFWIAWHPRRNLIAFLARLFERGPGFVEYHVCTNRGLYFYLFLTSLLLLVFSTGLLIVNIKSGLLILCVLGLALGSTTAFFSKSASEFIRLAPLHILSISSYLAGAIWALIVLPVKKIKPRLPTESSM